MFEEELENKKDKKIGDIKSKNQNIKNEYIKRNYLTPNSNASMNSRMN